MTSETGMGESQHDAAEQDARALAERLRSAPAEEILADLFSTMLSTAQVKVGRRDARLFIDVCAQALEYARLHMSEDLVHQVETALGQLRLSQVRAESERAGSEPEPNDLGRTPTPPTAGNRAQDDSDQRPASPSSRLWVPGR